jgi:cytidine deaminase
METSDKMKNELEYEIKKISEKYAHIISTEQLIEMANLAIKSKDNSYSPYSKFRVGCCLLSSEGKYYMGANVENISYGLTICAERCAVCNAVIHGEKKIKIAVVTTDMDYVVTPCGACRQVLLEFELQHCFMLTTNNEIVHMTADELLPSGCKINHLKNN